MPCQDQSGSGVEPGAHKNSADLRAMDESVESFHELNFLDMDRAPGRFPDSLIHALILARSLRVPRLFRAASGFFFKNKIKKKRERSNSVGKGGDRRSSQGKAKRYTSHRDLLLHVLYVAEACRTTVFRESLLGPIPRLPTDLVELGDLGDVEPSYTHRSQTATPMTAWLVQIETHSGAAPSACS